LCGFCWRSVTVISIGAEIPPGKSAHPHKNEKQTQASASAQTRWTGSETPAVARGAAIARGCDRLIAVPRLQTREVCLQMSDDRTSDAGYLRLISQVQEVTFKRLLDGSQKMLPDVAELCEDIGNLYLNIADDIRRGLKEGRLGSDPAQPHQRDVLESLLGAERD
jgi:hypothetical protein